MATNYGKAYVDCYHPDMDDEYCTVEVRWSHYYKPATREDPPEEEYEIMDMKLITSNGDYMPRGTEIPDWVTDDMLWDGIDLGDFNDGDDN